MPFLTSTLILCSSLEPAVHKHPWSYDKEQFNPRNTNFQFSITFFKHSKHLVNKHKKSCKRNKKYLTPTTTLKSSSSDLFIYFWKSNFVPGAKWTCILSATLEKKHRKTWLCTNKIQCTHSNKTITHCQVISLTNRSKKLTEEANLQKCKKRYYTGQIWCMT